MIRAIYPGSFDPITYGHLDVIDRAAAIFDRVIIAVAHNVTKEPLFTVEERMHLIRESTKQYGEIEIDSFSGLLVDYAVMKKAAVIIRGLRAVSDFEYELQMALMNRRMEGDVVTVFLTPNEKYTYLKSSIIREISQFGGDVSEFVPPVVDEYLKKKFRKQKLNEGLNEQ